MTSICTSMKEMEKRIELIETKLDNRNNKSDSKANDIMMITNSKSKLMELFRQTHKPTRQTREKLAVALAGDDGDGTLAKLLMKRINKWFRDQRGYFRSQVLKLSQTLVTTNPPDKTQLYSVVCAILKNKSMPNEMEIQAAMQILTNPQEKGETEETEDSE